MSAEPASKPVRRVTCDVCRKRKIKCVREDDDAAPPTHPLVPCQGCKTIEVECTFLHVYKRPGRPNGFNSGQKRKSTVDLETSHSGPSGSGSGTEGRPSSHQSYRRPRLSSPDSYRHQDGRQLATQSQPFPEFASHHRHHDTGLRDTYHENGYPLAESSQRLAQDSCYPPYPDNKLDSFSERVADHSQAAMPRGQPGPYFAHPAYPPHDTAGPSTGVNPMSMGTVISPPGPSQPFDSGGSQSAHFHNVNHSYQPSASELPGRPQLQRSATSSGSVPSYHYAPPQTVGGAPQAALQEAPSPYSGALSVPLPQMEDIASWSTISFFVSLYLRHSHALTPIVHKPNMTVCLATRLDQKDVEFRAFLLSLTSYVISQSPKSRLITHFTQDQLESLQTRTYRASQHLQSRRYKEPNLVQVGTLMCDYFFCTSTGRVARASATMAEAIALSYRMGMHSDERTRAIGIDHTEVQLRRRTFWHLYAIDKTEASAGFPSLMNDTEGLCSLPLETDDEYITAQGSFPQPPYRTSFMVGFVAVSKIFKIMSEVLFRHRSTQRRLTLLNPKSTPYGRAISPTADQGRVWLDSICEQTPQIGDDGVNDSGGFAELIRRESDWIVNAHDRIREVLDGLPPDLATQRFNGTGETLEESNHLTIGTTAPVGGARSGPGEEPSDLKAIFGMQVANCLITAASVQFALYDYKALLDAGADTVTESQEQTAREMYRLLSSIPLDHLAANGESMRGKVLRIILALLNRSRTPDQLSEEVKSFWNMYSMIQFVQVMPSSMADSVLPSREGTPTGAQRLVA